MNIAQTLWLRLVPLTVWIPIATLAVQSVIWIVRPTSPRTHRIAWACVLVSGVLFARIPINIPDGGLNAIARQQTDALVESLPERDPFAGAPTSAPRTEMPSFRSAAPSSMPKERIPAPRVGVRIESEVSAVSAAAMLASLSSMWPQWALWAWALGTVVLLGWSTLGYIGFVRRVRRLEGAPPEWEQEWRSLLVEQKIRRPIPLVASASYGPALCLLPSGYRLVVPTSLWESVSRAERIAILRHELAHYERNDLFKSLFARLVVAVHWFNPAAWWARRQFEAAGEWACDDAAAGRCGSIEFAKTLMQLAGVRFPSIPLTDAVGSGGLCVRIRRLLAVAPVVDGRWKPIFVAAVSFAVLALALFRVNRVAEATSPGASPAIAQESGGPRTPRRTIASPSTEAPRTGSAKLDQFGDAFPPGAAMRLGTIRFRPPNNGRRIALSPDAAMIATCGWNDSGICLTDCRSGRLLRQINPVEGKFWRHASIAFSPDGAWLLSAGTSGDGDGAIGPHPGTIQAWKITDGTEAWHINLEATAGKSVAMSADGKLIATGDDSGRVIIWDAASRRRLHTFRVEDGTSKQIRRRVVSNAGPSKKEIAYVEGIAFSRDARFVVAAEDADATIHVWELQSEKEITQIPHSHPDQVLSLAVTPDGSQIISGGNRVIRRENFGKPYEALNVRVPEIRVWHLQSGSRQREFKFAEPTAGDGQIALSADGTVLVSKAEGKILVWDPVAARIRREIPLTDWYADLAISRDGKTVAASVNESVRLWDVATGKLLSPLPSVSHERSLSTIAQSPDGSVIYTAGFDGRAIAWSSSSGKPLFEVRHGPRASINDLAVSDDGRRMATAGLSDALPSGLLYNVRIWDARSGVPIRELCDMQYDPRTHAGKRYWGLSRVAFSPDGRLVAVAATIASAGDIDVWEIETAKKIAEIRNPPTEQMLAIAFTADGKKLWTCEQGSLTRLWDISTATLERQLLASEIPPKRGTIYGPLAAVFASDLKSVVTSERSSIVTRDLATGDSVYAVDLPAHDLARCVALLRDGRFLAAGDANFANRPGKNVIRVFDRQASNEAFKFLAGNAQPLCLAFSPDGRRLLSGMSDTTALVWDLPAADAKPTK